MAGDSTDLFILFMMLLVAAAVMKPNTHANMQTTYIDPLKLENVIPHELNVDLRIEMATKCCDMDTVRRVDRAGQVVLQDRTRVQIIHNGLHVLADGYYGDWMTQLIQRCGGWHEPRKNAYFTRL